MPSEYQLKESIENRSHENTNTSTHNYEWTSKLILPAFVEGQYDPKCNVLQFVGDLLYKKYLFPVRFCMIQYPITNGFDGDGFKLLSNHLRKSAMEEGFKLLKNGNYPLKSCNTMAKKFSCYRVMRYRGDAARRSSSSSSSSSTFSSSSSITTTTTTTTTTSTASTAKASKEQPQCTTTPQVPPQTQSQTQSQSQQDGGNTIIRRRSKTQRPIHKECVCSFFFLVAMDDAGFYIVNGLGNTKHRHHPQLGKDQLPIDKVRAKKRMKPTTMTSTTTKATNSTTNTTTATMTTTNTTTTPIPTPIPTITPTITPLPPTTAATASTTSSTTELKKVEDQGTTTKDCVSATTTTTTTTTKSDALLPNSVSIS